MINCSDKVVLKGRSTISKWSEGKKDKSDIDRLIVTQKDRQTVTEKEEGKKKKRSGN